MAPDEHAAVMRDLGLRLLEESGVPDAAAWLDVVDDAVGQVVIRRCAKDRFSGVADHWAVTDQPATGYPDEATVRMMRRHCARLARGWMRCVATGGWKPAWSYSTHSLVAGIFRQHGLSLALLEAGSQPAHDHVMQFLCDEKGISIGTIKEEGGRIDVGSITPPGSTFSMSGKGRPYITVSGVSLPESVIQSLSGRRLRDVVKDPCIERAGPVRIEFAEILSGDDGMLLLVLEDRQVPISRAPTGTDRRWLRMPFHPWA